MQLTREQQRYTLFDGERPLWQIELDLCDAQVSPFREQRVWPEAGIAVVGGGAEVVFLELATGTVRRRVPVTSYFGHLAQAADLLFVLGWTEVMAFTPSLELRWHAREIAVDGVVFGEIDGGVVRVEAEMDPPGGWFTVELDLHTGAERSRIPSFTDGYEGAKK